MSAATLDPARERYVSLATFRRDGREVRTPVWVAVCDDRAYVFSSPEVGKVKRVRANGRARLAACTMRGDVTGPWTEAQARLVDEPALIARAHRALIAKYGWQMRLIDLMSRLSGRYARRAWIELELAS